MGKHTPIKDINYPDGIVEIPIGGSDGVIDCQSVLQGYAQICEILGKKLAHDLEHEEPTCRTFLCVYFVDPFIDGENHLFDICETLSKFICQISVFQHRAKILVQVSS